ncbi:MAG: AsmA-like C-terminal region-containing protein, partial [Betaproteobacteria bacterium]
LKRMGMDGAIRRGKGKLEGNIGWSGSPLALHTPSLQGQFGVDIESGQFLKAEPGVAKLLGVLNLQALPRRLTLDFRDVFSEGFSFDWVRGEVSIEQGLAHTDSLRMKGINAAVLMAGSADIGRETQDLRVVVVPEINAGTASLLASAVNPAMALGTFIAQWLLRRPLSEANTQEFIVRGTWADPVIERVARKSAPAAAPNSP